MRAQLVISISVALAVFLPACSKPESEAVSEPQSDAAEAAAESLRGPDAGQAGGADPSVADPDHYTVEFENEAVRILRIQYDAGDDSVMHYHPDSVAVFLTDIQGQMSFSDGSVTEIDAPAGSTVFSSAGEHKPTNTSDSAWEVVEVELKARDGAGSEPGGPDAIVADPDHYTTEFENDDVRVLRIAYGAGEGSVMHYHPDAVAVFLTDHLVAFELPDGTTEEISAAAGDALFVPGGQHLPRNIADSGWELILVELKQ